MAIVDSVRKAMPLLSARKEEKSLGSNLIEPDDKMVQEVIELFLDKKDLAYIKSNVKKEGTNLKLSWEQINEIDSCYKSESAKEVVVEEPVRMR